MIPHSWLLNSSCCRNLNHNCYPADYSLEKVHSNSIVSYSSCPRIVKTWTRWTGHGRTTPTSINNTMRHHQAPPHHDPCIIAEICTILHGADDHVAYNSRTEFSSISCINRIRGGRDSAKDRTKWPCSNLPEDLSAQMAEYLQQHHRISLVLWISAQCL